MKLQRAWCSSTSQQTLPKLSSWGGPVPCCQSQPRAVVKPRPCSAGERQGALPALELTSAQQPCPTAPPHTNGTQETDHALRQPASVTQAANQTSATPGTPAPQACSTYQPHGALQRPGTDRNSNGGTHSLLSGDVGPSRPPDSPGPATPTAQAEGSGAQAPATTHGDDQSFTPTEPEPALSTRSATQAPGVTIRVAHPTCMKTSRERHWALLKGLVPADQWPQTAVVLACLESIYRAEYLALGQAAVAALQAANAAPVPASADADDRSRSRSPSLTPAQSSSSASNADMAGAADKQQKLGDAQRQKKRRESPGSPLQAADVAAVADAVSVVAEVAAAGAAGAAAAMAAAAEAAVAAAGQSQPPPELAVVSEEELMEEEARLRDMELAALVSELVFRAHFKPLTRRDVEVAKNLNRDYLSQLFIVGDLRRMDGDLIEAVGHAGGGGRAWEERARTSRELSTQTSRARSESRFERRRTRDALTPGISHIPATDSEQPALESEKVLLLKRCWGEETTTGRLVVQKLDFLQTLVVTAILEQTRSALVSAASATQSYLSKVAEEIQAANTPMYAWPPEDRSQVQTNDMDTLGQPQQPQQQLQQQQTEPEAVAHHQPAVDTSLTSSDSLHGARQLPQDAQNGGVVDQPTQPAPTTDPGADLSDLSMPVASVASSSSEDRVTDSEDDGQGEAWEEQGGVQAQGEQGAVTGAAWSSMRAAEALRALAQWFSERGVGPKLDIMDIADIDTVMPVREPARLVPLTLTKVALREVMGSHPLRDGVGGLLQLLFQPVNLREPSIKEFAVMYRRVSETPTRRPTIMRTLLRAGRRLRLLPQPAAQPPKPRPPIQIRIYRDLALPTWQLALPDKLLQFRPLDLLRADLFALTGLVALLAQARYDSLLLDIITFISATVFLVRIALGFKRMDDRYRNQVAEVLREKTIASDGTALEYLAAAAGLQQFKQTSLAYLYTLYGTGGDSHSVTAATAASQPAPASSTNSPTNTRQTDVSGAADPATSTHHHASTGAVLADDLAESVERLLLKECGLQVRFDADEALSELVRLGLAHPCPLGRGMQSPRSSTPHTYARPRTVHASSSYGSDTPRDANSPTADVAQHAEQAQRRPSARVSVVRVDTAQVEGMGSKQEAGQQCSQSSLVHEQSTVGSQAAHQARSPSPEPGGVTDRDLRTPQQGYQVVGVERGMQLMQRHWDGLLWQRVDTILRDFE